MIANQKKKWTVYTFYEHGEDVLHEWIDKFVVARFTVELRFAGYGIKYKQQD